MQNVEVKDLYNTYLKASGKGLNRPYRVRQNFEGFEETKMTALLKLLHFFQNYNTVDPFEFFYAPYVVFPDVKNVFPLTDYIGMRAIDTYKTYLSIKREQTPDEQKEDIRESLLWLGNMLNDKKMSLLQYANKQDDYYPKVLLDYKTNKINIFVLVAIDSIYGIFDKLEKNDIEQIFPSYNKLGFLRSALFSSLVGKKTCDFLKKL